jgi:hypothetical protein
MSLCMTISYVHRPEHESLLSETVRVLAGYNWAVATRALRIASHQGCRLPAKHIKDTNSNNDCSEYLVFPLREA